MAERFSDSFAPYASAADLLLRWSGSNEGTLSVLNTGTPFGTGQYAQITPALPAGGNIFKIWNYNDATIYGNVCLETIPGNGTSGNGGFIAFGDQATPPFPVCFHGIGQIVLHSGGPAGTVLYTSAQGIYHASTWDTWQFALTIGTTTGSFALYKNGSTTPSFNVTGINTQGGTSNAYVNTFLVGVFDGSSKINITNLMIVSSTGGVPNSLPPDLRTAQLLPASDVAVAFSTSSGTTHYTLVNETTEDGDATYVYSNTAGQEDRYSVSSLPTTVTSVYGVNPFAFWRKTDAGTRTAAVQLKANGTEITAVTDTPGQSYVWSPDAFQPLDPTGVAWTATTVNGANVGVKITA